MIVEYDLNEIAKHKLQEKTIDELIDLSLTAPYPICRLALAMQIEKQSA
jgi:hypothetical protein